LTGCSGQLETDITECKASALETNRQQMSGEKLATYLRECMRDKGWPLKTLWQRPIATRNSARIRLAAAFSSVGCRLNLLLSRLRRLPRCRYRTGHDCRPFWASTAEPLHCPNHTVTRDGDYSKSNGRHS